MFISILGDIAHLERKKALKSGGPQRLKWIDLYGKDLIPIEKLYNQRAMPLWSSQFLCLCIS